MNQQKTLKFHNRASLVLYFLRGSWQYFVLSILFASIVSLADLINPKIIEYTVDSVIGSEPLSAPAFVRQMVEQAGGITWFRGHLALIAGGVLAVAAAGAVCRYLFMLFDSLGAETFVRHARDGLYSHIVRLPYAWHGENHTGDIIQRCTSDVETIKLFVSEQLMSLFRVVLLIVLSLYFMMRIHWKLALAEVIFIPVMVLSSAFFYTKIGSAFEKVDSEEGRLSSIAQENLTGVRVVRAFGRERFEQERFARQNQHYTKLWFHLQLILASFWTSGNVYATVRNLIVTVLGVTFCVQGTLTAGGFIAFMSYNALISLPVRRLGRIITEMSKAAISIDRLRYIMNAEEETFELSPENRTAGTEASSGKASAHGGYEAAVAFTSDKESESRPADASRMIFNGDICFEHVSFQYPGGTGEVLRDVSFTVPAGKTVGILGGTGSGKTTLISLIDRLYELDPGKGRITIGGKELKEIPRGLLRENIGMVLQEPYLFSGTIAENIAMSGEKAAGTAAGHAAMSGQEAEGTTAGHAAMSGEEAASTEFSHTAGMPAEKPGNQSGQVQAVEEAGVSRAASVAALDETIEKLEQGMQTFVGERGVTLSGGQRQRVAIAQMLYRKTPIMIFDDSLSAVDAETDAKIRAALREQTAGATVILIAHRITTLMHADEIIVLDQGGIRERGTHRELLEQNGIYRHVYELQTRDADL